MVTWYDYAAWLGAEIRQPLPEMAAPEVSALVTDTRSLMPGQWFVPIQGPNFDGHKFIATAMSKGAAGFFFADSRRHELEAVLLRQGIAVNDPLIALQKAAAGWRGFLGRLGKLKILALTGSVGKTTTKEMLAGILRQAGPTFATHASFNNEIGVPKSLQALTEAHRYAVLEFGARQPGNIRFLCEMAGPDIVCLLNVGVAHLGIFGSPEALLATKLEIFGFSPKEAMQVAYADDPRILAGAMATAKRTLTFGLKSADPGTAMDHVQVLGSVWHRGTGGMNVSLRIQGRDVEIPLGIAHTAMPVNAAAAAAMALAAGISVTTIVEGLSGFAGVTGRFRVHRRQHLAIIDDTYNANPDSMRAGLSTLAQSFFGQRQILVLGDMLELGPTSAEDHTRLGQTIVAPLAPARLYTVGPEAKYIAAGAAAGGLAVHRIRSFDSVEELLKEPTFSDLDALALAGDVVYAKGSNGVRLGRLVEHLLGDQRQMAHTPEVVP